MCHVSHAYPDGASLYYTFLARSRSGQEIEQWREVKAAACEAIVRAEGTITHHHAVGRDHAPYMEAEVGELGSTALRAVKERLDPTGIMNPGKLLPTPDGAPPLRVGRAPRTEPLSAPVVPVPPAAPRGASPGSSSRRRWRLVADVAGIVPRTTDAPVCGQGAGLDRLARLPAAPLLAWNQGDVDAPKRRTRISVGRGSARRRSGCLRRLVAKEASGKAMLVGVVEPGDVVVGIARRLAAR